MPLQLRKNDPRWHLLPEKIEGEHRWTAVVGVRLTDGQVRQFVRGNLASITEREILGVQEPGCVDCDKSASEAEQVCPGLAWVPGERN